MSSSILESWIAISPLHNCLISDEPPINGTWVVGEVAFHSRRSLQQLLLLRPKLIAQVEELVIRDHQSFAVFEVTDSSDLDELRAFSKLREATYILAAASLSRSLRSSRIGFGIVGDSFVSSKSVIFVDKDGGSCRIKIKNQGSIMPLELNSAWYNEINEFGYLKIFKAIVDNTIDHGWRRQIKQCAAMLGRSLISTELADSFLLNVIALETLLTEKGERNGNKLSERVIGLTGWDFYSDLDTFRNRVKKIHAIRCDIVHDGDYRSLTVESLLWSDLVLKNCLWNVVFNPTVFTSKKQMAKLIDGYAISMNWPKNGYPELCWVGCDESLNSDGVALYPF